MRRYGSRVLLALTVLAVAMVSLVSCGSAPTLKPETRVVPDNAIDPADPDLSVEDLGLKIAWRQSVALGGRQHDVRQVFLDRETCFVETFDANLFAYNVPDGVQLFLHETSAPIFVNPVATGDYVYVIYANRLWQLRRLSGAVGQVNPPRAAVATLSAADGDLIFGTGDARVVFYTVDGAEQKWNAPVEAPVQMRPIVLPGLVLVAGFRGGIQAMERNTGKILWRFMPKDGEFTRAACSDGKRAFAAATDGILYAFSASTGAIAWQFPMATLANGDPVCVDGRVYVPTYGRGMLCFDAEKGGEELWAAADAARILTVGARYVYVVLKGGELAALQRDSGEVVWKRPLPSDVLTLTNVHSDAVLLATKNGFVLALREIR